MKVFIFSDAAADTLPLRTMMVADHVLDIDDEKNLPSPKWLKNRGVDERDLIGHDLGLSIIEAVEQMSSSKIK